MSVVLVGFALILLIHLVNFPQLSIFNASSSSVEAGLKETKEERKRQKFFLIGVVKNVSELCTC